MAWGDITNAELDYRGYKKHANLMTFFKDMGAYSRCSEECVLREGGKLIDVKWIDVNKGDQNNPQHQYR